MPGALLRGVAGKRGREAVKRQDQRLRHGVEQRREAFVVGPVKLREPGFVACVIQRIAWDGVAVAGDGAHGGAMLVAVEIAHQAADIP